MEFDIGRLGASEDGKSATSLAPEDLWGILEHPHNVPIDARHDNYVGWIFLIRDKGIFRQGEFTGALVKFKPQAAQLPRKIISFREIFPFPIFT